LGIGYIALWDILNRSPNIPMNILAQFCRIARLGTEERFRLCGRIERLVYGRISGYRTAKAIHVLGPELATIAGGVVADGYLYRTRKVFPGGRYGETSRIVVRDQNVDAISLLCDWTNRAFGLNVHPQHGKNHWYLAFNNRIVFHYLNAVFGIPVGAKSRTVKVPAVIRGSPNLERAFIQGLFLFDGGIDHRTGYVDFCLMSRPLITTTSRMLKAHGIEPDFISSHKDRNGWKIRIRRRAKLKLFLRTFCIPGTGKYAQLASFIEPQQLTEKELLGLFPRTRSGALGYADVLRAITELKRKGLLINAVNLSREIGRKKTVAYEYLRRLETLGLCKVNKYGRQRRIQREDSSPDGQPEEHPQHRYRGA
jgi:hypothetical protein